MKLADRLLALMGLGLFSAFCLVLVLVVQRIDLALVVVSVMIMVAYDFYNETVREPAAALKAKAEAIRQRADAMRAQNDPHAQRDQI
jgi:hypothetical protein